MNTYPIQYEYHLRDGAIHSGFAADEAGALAIVRAQMLDGGFEESDLPTDMRIDSVQAGHVWKEHDKAAAAWAEEIAAGWASLSPTYGGWMVMVETWVIDF